MDKLSFLEAAVKSQHAVHGLSKYMSEEDVIQITGLSKESLRKKRKAGVLTGYSPTGKNIKYLRKEIEAYMDGRIIAKSKLKTA